MLEAHWVIQHKSRGRGRFGFLMEGKLPRSRVAAFQAVLRQLEAGQEEGELREDLEQ